MAAARYINVVAGKLKQVAAAVVGTADAIAAMDATGRLDISMMPVGVGAEVLVAPASENLVAGNWVNLHLNAGVINVRKADATTNGKPAHGFVLAASLAPANATVFFESNTNTQCAGLTIGSDYYLDAAVPGGIVTVPPAAAGNIIQFIGRAQSATAINFINGEAIELA